MTTDLAVELCGITKRFANVIANDDVNLAVRRGEVQALLGENGAGKSTLMNILYGLYQPEAGCVSIMGVPVRMRSPADALAAGIGMVPQHFVLIPTLTVVENVVLGNARAQWLDLGGAARTLEMLAARYGWKIDPWAVVADLSLGDHQRIEILKALFRHARILILDEPTSVLTPQQADELILTLRRFAADGGSVIFISHKLDEVMRVSDRVTVMRDGRVVVTVATAATSKQELARLMVGREVVFPVARALQAEGEPALVVAGMSARGATPHATLRKITFSVRQGEVFGVAGVDGNGQAELAAVLCGLRRDYAGEVSLFGVPLPDYLARPTRGGVGHIPADRRRQGLVLDMSVGENLTLRDRVAGALLPSFAALAAKARGAFEDFGIKAAGLEQRARYLSGGNQQRIVLARECGDIPAMLVAVQPTQGLDIAATEDVYDTIIRLRGEGVAIVYISTELDEILALSDRMGIISNGALAGVFDTGSADLATIGMMLGGSNG